MTEEIWVFVEPLDGTVRKVSLELLCAASGFAKKSEAAVGAVVFGNGIDPVVQAVKPYADRVYVLEDRELSSYTSDGYTLALTDLVRAHTPAILLAGSTSMGKDLFPRVAMRLETGLASDCTHLEVQEDGRLIATRPIYGGKVFCQVSIPTDPQMATVRPNTFPVEKIDKLAEPVVVDASLHGSEIRQRVEGVERAAREKVDVSEAEVVIGVGRGIKDPENLRIVEELAEVLGATVGVTRAVVDNGWWDVNGQIGKSGKNISARLYFALGLSGAVHHVLGIQTCKTAVAVNSDPNALIFNYADYGLVGDLMTVIPVLKDEIAKLKDT
jgi:electron transfer flavoprotein alpha subunit